MFKSIRWSLLFWYTLILTLVVAGFAGTLYYKMRRSLYREVDVRLKAHARALAGALDRERDGSYEIDLSDEYLRRSFGGDDDDPYYVIWDERGEIVSRSHPGLEAPRPEGGGTRDRRSRREVVVPSPEGPLVMVGQRLEDQRDYLRELLGALIGAGAGVLVLALAGGWFLASRALRPISRMSQVASTLSASSLSGRIDVGQTESELGKLARTLNDTFDRLERAFEQQTRFTADASHELRTPLSILMSQTELALRKERSAGEYREALGVCLRAAHRMKAVVEGLLTLARADVRDLDLRRERFDLGKVVEETAAMLGPLAIEKKVTLTVSAEPAEVLGDRERWREVVTNLVSNALRYNREGGRVDAALSVKGNEAVLTVADTGIGIPEKDWPHVFERFYRVDKARSREQGGSGLGLSITKWIVEAHGGSLSFISREGEGTTFTVRLALAAAGA